MKTSEKLPLDVWLRISEGEDQSEAEANTYATEYGFRVDWYLTAVGLVSSREFITYEQATKWLSFEGFVDYSS
jgi:hypothetical protein